MINVMVITLRLPQPREICLTIESVPTPSASECLAMADERRIFWRRFLETRLTGETLAVDSQCGALIPSQQDHRS